MATKKEKPRAELELRPSVKAWMLKPIGGSDQLSQLVGDTGISGRRYLGYLGFGPKSWLRMFELFAEAKRHPLLVHCTAGKDRTGVATAFLLAVPGLERQLIGTFGASVAIVTFVAS